VAATITTTTTAALAPVAVLATLEGALRALSPGTAVEGPSLPLAGDHHHYGGTTNTTTTTAVAPKKPKKAGGGNPHKEGVFSPIVVAAGVILGEEQLNKIRGQAIALHSDLIKSFVDTSDSTLGQAVLRQLFTLVDTDNSGYLDKTEVAQALNLLGFKWLGDSQVDKIFERADADGDKTISLDEFMKEAPKTLRTNLVKLAKSNGGEMGLLV